MGRTNAISKTGWIIGSQLPKWGVIFTCSVLLALIPSVAFGQDKVKVAASFPVLADFVSNVCGDFCDVSVLTPPGTKTEEILPAQTADTVLEDTHILFLNGWGLEPWVSDWLDDFDGEAQVVAVNFESDLIWRGLRKDPYTWHDPENVAKMLTIIRAWLEDAPQLTNDTQALEQLAENEAKYLAEIQATLSPFKRRFASLQDGNSRALTSILEFSYLERWTGLDLLYVGELKPQPNAVNRAVFALKKLIQDYDAKAVFFTTQQTQGVKIHIQNTTGANLGGILYPYNLSASDEPASSYLAMMQHNLETILTVLEN